jgi:serine/threonine-protein kinase
MRRLLARCLEKDRSRRLPQIAIAVFEIEEALAGSPSDASVAELHIRREPKRTLALGFAAGIVGALVVATAAWLTLLRDASPAAVTQLLVGVTPAEQIGGNDGRPDRTAMVISPDGRTLVFSAVRAGQRALYVRRFDEAEAILIPGTENGVGPFFSPDGQWIGYWSAGEIRKLSLTGGPSVRVAEVPQVFGATWGDDDRIVFGRAGGGLWEVPAAGGTAVLLTMVNREQGEVSHRLPLALPGGDTILFTVTKNRFPRWDQTHISAYSRRTGATKVIVTGGADGRYIETGHLLYVREGVAFAAPFDRQRIEVTGGSVGVVADVMQSAYHRGALLDSGAAQLTVSATGTLVYIPGGVVTPAERTVVSVDRAGRSEVLPIARRAFATLRVSPDGQQIALSTFGRDRDVWLFARGQGTLSRLTAPGRNGVPIWTPDGAWLTYASGTGGPDDLRRVRSDGSGSPEPLIRSEHSLVPGAWTPDGRQLFYYTIPAADASVNSTWMWNAMGNTAPTAVATVSTTGGGLDVSPDGRWIAYHSDNDGQLEVYVQAHPGPGPRYQASTNGGISPIWRSDGRELFYVETSVPPDTGNSARLSSAGIRIMAVPVQLKPTLTLGPPQRLFEGRYQVNLPGRGYDVTADGQRFVLFQEQEHTPDAITHMTVVQNWHEQLRRLVPPE